MDDPNTGAQPAQPEDAAHPIDGKIADWVRERVYNSPIAQATDAYSYLVNVALPDLVRRLKGDA